VKQASTGLLMKAIRTIAQGGTFFQTSQDGRRMPPRPSGEHAASSPLARLTTREREVLQLVAEGKANKQTADVLGISIKTVEKHRQNLMTKLRIHDTAGLTRYAIGAGVVENHGTEDIS
jgi:DNA-binding NarL/FixJ family response regulator